MLSISLLVTAANAQNEAPKKGVFSVGVHTAQGITYPIYTSFRGSTLSRYSMAAGLIGKYKFKKAIALYFGLDYQRFRIIDERNGALSFIWPQDTWYIATLNYLSVPVGSKFYLNQKRQSKIKLYALVGLQFDALVSSSNENYDDRFILDEKDVNQPKKIMLSGRLGFGIEIQAKKDLSFFAHPFFQSSLHHYPSRQANQDYYKSLIRFMGIDLGLVYHFK